MLTLNELLNRLDGLDWQVKVLHYTEDGTHMFKDLYGVNDLGAIDLVYYLDYTVKEVHTVEETFVIVIEDVHED